MIPWLQVRSMSTVEPCILSSINPRAIVAALCLKIEQSKNSNQLPAKISPVR